jgi:hypothetical protein
MHAKFRLAVLACAAMAAGCGGTTRIVALDSDRYQMTVYAHPAIVGSTAQLLERAWQEGADTCARQGRKLQPEFDAKQNPDHVDRTAYAQMNFKCVEPQPAR